MRITSPPPNARFSPLVTSISIAPSSSTIS
jgi:hypothetical protein